MRISINLATRPFIELRPLFARLRLAMIGLAVLAAGLGVGLYFLNAQARVAKSKMDDLQSRTLAFQNERAANEARMRQPANRAVLERSKFLNAVFAQKSFSWTSVMMDLERVLPVGVQVTSIEPAISPDGDVNIRLRVSGEREKAVDLVRNLERSQRFLHPRLANETAQVAEKGTASSLPVGVPGGVEFDILSGYNPLPDKIIAEKLEKGAGPKVVVAKPAGPKAPRKTPPVVKASPRPAAVPPARIAGPTR
jgi:type IV pilus assembly protein PilN